MQKRIKDEEVISKSVKGVRKKTTKEETKEPIYLTKLNKYKVYFILVILLIGLLSLYSANKDKVLLTINDYDYDIKEYNIYVYSAKYNYFGKDVENISQNDLNAMYDDSNNIKVIDYLKSVALNDLKTNAAIKEMALDNNVSLSKADLKELDKEKKEFIKSLGGQSEYKKFLKENSTSDDAYDEMCKTDKLYKKLVKEIYGDGKLNDLTSEEIEQAKVDYASNYFKIEQVILPIVNVSTGKNLDTTVINQKEVLANSIVEFARKGQDMEELIKKYSEGYDSSKPLESYYKKGELVSELEQVVLKLNPGEVSNSIKTKYAYHVIKRLELDDAKLDDYLEELREQKCIKDLKNYIDKLKIVYQDAYEKNK